MSTCRKRQSVIVRAPGGGLVLYCKGADNVMLERLDPAQTGQELLLEHLRVFASEGLRTLVLARRDISLAEYQQWNRLVLYGATFRVFLLQPHSCSLKLYDWRVVNLNQVSTCASHDDLSESALNTV